MVQIQRRVNGQLMTQLSTQVPGCMPGDKLTRDWSQVAALQEDQDLMVKRLVLAAGGAIETVNEARESLRLPRMTDPEYDEIRSGGGQSLEESQAAEAETARLQGQGADNGRAYRRFLAERWSEPRAIPSRNGHNLIPS